MLETWVILRSHSLFGELCSALFRRKPPSTQPLVDEMSAGALVQERVFRLAGGVPTDIYRVAVETVRDDT